MLIIKNNLLKIILWRIFMNYKHYIITRFNISTRYDCRLNDPDNPPMLKILDEDYLEERFNLF